MDPFLAPTPFFDYDHPHVEAWIRRQLDGVGDDPVTQIQHLYLAVRDGIRYNPYVFQTNASSFRASDALKRGESYCIPKAVLLGSAARAIGIPSRLGLADVRNHLSSVSSG
ncbi:transglutaminase superfamily protein [Tamilnaduibacter salinus]|uniref:Transglutaminase superfamily protein n=1 Tax=Tamilnaduibacter salinus TaxID=1484056 RepID=A0A2U1CUA1_9GAMM|nr:transglutaminase superfamily protein [Tamilnaduibacter salinus]